MRFFFRYCLLVYSVRKQNRNQSSFWYKNPILIVVYFLELLALEISACSARRLAECLRNDQHEREPESHEGKGTVFIFLSFSPLILKAKAAIKLYVYLSTLHASSKREIIHVITLLWWRYLQSYHQWNFTTPCLE